MKATRFPGYNKTLLPPDEGRVSQDIVPLPVYTDGEVCVSRWRPTWRERLRLILWGSVWVFVRSGETQPPIMVGVARTVFEADDPVPIHVGRIG